jgi:hypothetical protein
MPGVFPTLRTGATAQYPMTRLLDGGAELVCFLDGSAQAYRSQATGRRRWTIDLSLLDDSELARLRGFFEQQKGAWGAFSFTDPATGAVFPACSFENDVFPQTQEADSRNSARLVIYEHA